MSIGFWEVSLFRGLKNEFFRSRFSDLWDLDSCAKLQTWLLGSIEPSCLLCRDPETSSDGSNNVRSSMFDLSMPKIGCSSSITIRWTRSSLFDVRKNDVRVSSMSNLGNLVKALLGSMLSKKMERKMKIRKVSESKLKIRKILTQFTFNESGMSRLENISISSFSDSCSFGMEPLPVLLAFPKIVFRCPLQLFLIRSRQCATFLTS